MASYFGQRTALRLGLIAALFGLMSVFLFLQSTTILGDRLCTVCHAGSEWTPAGGHAATECGACHAEGGVFGVLDMRVRVTGMAAAYLPGPGPASAPVASERCRSCHDAMLGGVVVAKGIRMSHAEPVDRGWQCVDCHARGMHEGGVDGRPDVAMEECLRCHAVSSRSNDCILCHAEEVTREERIQSGSYAAVHGPNQATTHGMGDLKACSVCHAAEFCVRCHDLELPHAYGWLNEHGPDSTEADCTTCHAQEFCIDCHVVDIPHAEGYMAGHSAAAVDEGQEACFTCHDGASCDACHLGHVHPGLDPELVRALRARAGLD